MLELMIKFHISLMIKLTFSSETHRRQRALMSDLNIFTQNKVCNTTDSITFGKHCILSNLVYKKPLTRTHIIMHICILSVLNIVYKVSRILLSTVAVINTELFSKTANL